MPYEDRQDNDELFSRLGSIESKVDLLLNDRPGIYRRVTKLERDNSWIKGGAAVLSFLAGLVTWMLSRVGVL